MKRVGLMVVLAASCGIACAAQTPAPVGGVMQGVVNNLQKQIRQVQTSIPKQVSDQAKATQQSIAQLQQQMQKQVNTLQKQIQQVQATLNIEIQRLQKQVVEVSQMR